MLSELYYFIYDKTVTKLFPIPKKMSFTKSKIYRLP